MSIKTVFPEGSRCGHQVHHYKIVWAIQSDAQGLHSSGR